MFLFFSFLLLLSFLSSLFLLIMSLLFLMFLFVRIRTTYIRRCDFLSTEHLSRLMFMLLMLVLMFSLWSLIHISILFRQLQSYILYKLAIYIVLKFHIYFNIKIFLLGQDAVENQLIAYQSKATTLYHILVVFQLLISTSLNKKKVNMSFKITLKN